MSINIQHSLDEDQVMQQQNIQQIDLVQRITKNHAGDESDGEDYQTLLQKRNWGAANPDAHFGVKQEEDELTPDQKKTAKLAKKLILENHLHIIHDANEAGSGV